MYECNDGSFDRLHNGIVLFLLVDYCDSQDDCMIRCVNGCLFLVSFSLNKV